jgi:hypothetical protein
MIGPVLGRDRGYQRLDPDDVHPTRLKFPVQIKNFPDP